MDIFTGDDVPPQPVDEDFDGVEGNQVSWMFCDESFWFSGYFSTVCLDDASGAGDPLWVDAHTAIVFDDATDGGWFGAGEVVLVAELFEKRVEFLFTEVGVFFSQALDFFHNMGIVSPLSFVFWRSGAVIETLKLPSACLQFLLPQVERTFLHSVCLFDRFRPVFLPKADNASPFLRYFTDHIREP